MNDKIRELQEEVLDLRKSLHEIRTICVNNSIRTLVWNTHTTRQEFSALSEMVGFYLLKDHDARDKAILRWANALCATLDA
jgi:hypothetical protein